MSEGGDWHFQLFDCFAAPLNCIWACCVPCGICCQQATTTKLIIDQEENAPTFAFLFACLGCCFGVAYNRQRIRKTLGIGGSYLIDCILAFFLPCCTMVREWREVMTVKGLKEDEFVWKAWKGYSAI
ncbi:unnamed protein product [Blepharisma stoltei]|uniref:PLAC8 family protein n=1 Tax=Blepharisma stoltei TaxID=1481888 RepID=A0AAU9J5E6_9CILI|nr:unnamed protein product [Blepharisma stoltei]